jgi:hypothetical protein
MENIMVRKIQANQNDEQRFSAWLKAVKEQSGEISGSSTPAPEKARKKRAVEKVREEL